MGDFNPDLVLPDSIKDILTLRYNPAFPPVLPRLSAGDFGTVGSRQSSEFVRDAMKSHMRKSIVDDSGVSIALSGGVDSALCLAMLREAFPGLHISAISVRFAESVDETPQAAEIADRFDAEHQIVDLDNFLVELPEAIGITGQPFWDMHWYHVVKRARSNGNCLVSGDGGDELFGGYTFRYRKFLSMTGRDTPPIERVRAYLECHQRDWVEDQEDLFGRKSEFSWGDIHARLLPYFDNPLPPIQQVFLADYNGKLLYNFGAVSSTLHEHFGIKSVMPMLSKEMISYAVRLDPELKYDEKGNVGKLPLRALLAKYVDGGTPTRAKHGFSANTLSLWKSHAYRICREYLEDARTAHDGWIDASWLKDNLCEEQDVRHVNKFLGLLAFEIWYRIFITGDLRQDTKLR